MGIGFHLYVEQKVGDTWQALRGDSQYHMHLANKEIGRYGKLEEYFREEGSNRLEWILFNEDTPELWALLLPNIPNTQEYEVKGIAEPRGLPEDISSEVKDIIDMWGSTYYGYTASHCTVKELITDRPDLWTQTPETIMYIKVKDYIKYGHALSAEVKAYESKTYLGVNPRIHSELDIVNNEEKMMELFPEDYVFTYGSFPLYHVYRPFLERVQTIQEQLNIQGENIRFVYLLEN